jgi:signal transduction histidine kinase
MSKWHDDWHRAHEQHLEARKRWAAERAKFRDHRRSLREHLHRDRAAWKEVAGRKKWWPWMLQAQMHRRMVSWFGVALLIGVFLGWRFHSGGWHWWQLVITFVIMWGSSGAIAWRLTHPLLHVIKAARDLGAGKLDTRIPTSPRHDELHVLASAINDMAERIEIQIKDQRELLAAVSHELRTPLGHMRVLIDTARDNGSGSGSGSGKPLDDLEREVIVLDDLVGKLLASSRLEFGNLDRRPRDVGALVTDVATSAGVPPEAIEAEGDVRAPIDLTLVHRAVANLLDNARTHGGGVVAVRIVRRAGQVAIEVDDAGPGVPADRRADAFRAFVPSAGGGLGLGLALVSRIAVAHGGGAWISDRPGGGARVGFAVAV